MALPAPQDPGTVTQKFHAIDVCTGATLEFSAPRFLFNMPTSTISVRNSYAPSRDGQRFLVNVLLDAAVPHINVDLNWMATAKRRSNISGSRSSMSPVVH